MLRLRVVQANFFLNNTGAKGWVIHLSGGGWRFSGGSGGSAELQSQQSSTHSAEGAEGAGTLTRDGAPRAEGDGHCYGKCDGILSDDADQNPLFHTWNKVWIPISGTSFTGDVWTQTEGQASNFVRGKRIQMAVVQDLLDNFGMKGATNIILTGGSSGGLATYLTCDRVGEQVKAANASTRFTCLGDAGYFLHHDDMHGGK